MHYLNKTEVLEFINERAYLFDKAGISNPFASSAWILHFIEQVATQQWTFIVPEWLVDGHSLMLLYSDHESSYRRGSVVNYYSSLYSPLISSITSVSGRRFATNKLVNQMIECRPRCSVVKIHPVDKHCIDTSSLINSFSECGWSVRQFFCFGNWYLPCKNLSFQEYMMDRDSKTYNTWIRKSKKFGGGGEYSRWRSPGNCHCAARCVNSFERL